jgi:nucleotide-binding universal stress UspA family protein
MKIMSKRILVPLDGDEVGEAITPVVTALAAESGGSVRLLRVAPVPELVVGSHGHGKLRRLLRGSLSEDIVRHAHRPVLVVKAQASNSQVLSAEYR